MGQVGVLLVIARAGSPRGTAVCIQSLGVQRSPSTPLCLGRPCFTPSPTRRRLVPLLGVCFSVCCFADWHAPVRTCKKLMGVSACLSDYRKCWECDTSLFNAPGISSITRNPPMGRRIVARVAVSMPIMWCVCVCVRHNVC